MGDSPCQLEPPNGCAAGNVLTAEQKYILHTRVHDRVTALAGPRGRVLCVI